MFELINYIIPMIGQTQLEDPCLEWRRRQQEMLSNYLVSANDQLQVSYFFSVYFTS